MGNVIFSAYDVSFGAWDHVMVAYARRISVKRSVKRCRMLLDPGSPFLYDCKNLGTGVANTNTNTNVALL